VAQGVSPEFKPHYCKKKERKKEKGGACDSQPQWLFQDLSVTRQTFLLFVTDAVEDVVSQNTAPKHIEYFKLKESEKKHVEAGFS
jgi:hypothetical protein